MKQNGTITSINITIGAVLIIIAAAETYWMQHFAGFDIYTAMLFAAIANATIYALFYLSNYAAFIRFKQENVFLVLLQSALYAAAWMYVSRWTLETIYNGVFYELFYEKVWLPALLLAFVVFFFFNLLYYFGKIIQVQQQKLELETNVQQLKNDAELFKLRQQLHPHFLFNSLNSINALIGANPKLAREMLMKLSTFLRQTLKKEDDELVLLSNELEELDLYLDIEKVRFGDRLMVEKQLPETISDIKIPPFLLQPLVENAIKFGLYGTLGNVLIAINIIEMEHFFKFEISNPYDSETATPKGTGFGLKSISRRLYLLYARNDLLKTEKIEGKENELSFYIARLLIPKSTINQ